MSELSRDILRLICASLLLLSAAESAALEIGVAPLFVTGIDGGATEPPGGECGERLCRLMQEALSSGSVSLRSLKGDDGPAPRSFLEAALLAEQSGSDCLLYGYIRRGEFTWEGELKLFDRTSGRVAASFFDRDADDEYDRFMTSLAGKVVDYLVLEAGLSAPVPPPAPVRNIFSIPLRLAYPAAGGAGYGRISRGIIAGESGLLITPLRREGQREFLTGCLLAYRLTMNAAGYEAFRLHGIGVALPATLLFPVGGTDRLSVGAGVGVRFDLLEQDRRYYGVYRAVSVAPTIDLSLAYERVLRRGWSLGFRTELETALYVPAETAVLSGLQMRYEFPSRQSRRKEISR